MSPSCFRLKRYWFRLVIYLRLCVADAIGIPASMDGCVIAAEAIEDAPKPRACIIEVTLRIAGLAHAGVLHPPQTTCIVHSLVFDGCSLIQLAYAAWSN